MRVAKICCKPKSSPHPAHSQSWSAAQRAAHNPHNAPRGRQQPSPAAKDSQRRIRPHLFLYDLLDPHPAPNPQPLFQPSFTLKALIPPAHFLEIWFFHVPGRQEISHRDLIRWANPIHPQLLKTSRGILNQSRVVCSTFVPRCIWYSPETSRGFLI
jgi:hypothetical protein